MANQENTPESLTKAEAMLAEARKANPGNLNLLILSGVAARMQKKMKPAEDYFVEAHGISPANGDVINQLALLLIEQADQAKRDRALQFASMSAQLNNQNPDAQITLAWVLYQFGRTGDAETAFATACNWAISARTAATSWRKFSSSRIAPTRPSRFCRARLSG